MRKKLGQMLIEAGAIDELQLRAALGEQRRWGQPLGRTLVEMRLLQEDDLVRVLGQQLGLPSIDLDTLAIPREVIALVPGEVARHHHLVPFAQPMKFLDVAMLDPTDLGIIDELRIRTQRNIRTYLAGPRMIERALAKYYMASVSLDEPVLPPQPAPRGDPAAEVQARRRRPVDTITSPAPAGTDARDAEIAALQARISKLESLVARDEDVLRKLLSLLIERGVASREEILERLR